MTPHTDHDGTTHRADHADTALQTDLVESRAGNRSGAISVSRRTVLGGAAALGAGAALSVGTGPGAARHDGSADQHFRVRVENVASTDTYAADASTGGAVWLTPGAYGVHAGSNPILTEGEAASPGLEAIAEAGIPTGFPNGTGLVSELDGDSSVSEAGAFTPADTTVDPDDPTGSVPGAPPIAPGGAFEFVVGADAGERLSFATMFVPSNDLFYAPDSDGIALFDADGSPRNGDVTGDVALWDAGTEPNQQPGFGADQAPAQGSPDQGADEGGVVRRIGNVNDGYSYPPVSDSIRVTITPVDPQPFRVRIENAAALDTYAADASTGGAVWLTPGAYATFTGTNPAFTEGEAASPGLEALAEAGFPTGFSGQPGLVAELDGASNVTTSGAFTPADTVTDPNDPTGSVPGAPPIAPGGAFEFTVNAVPGDALTFATMFVPSNDLFYAPGSDGIPLFDASGNPRSGDVTGDVELWDAGTEPNQQPGFGADQAPAQGSPDQGADEGSVVRRIGTVSDGYSYPSVPDSISVSLQPASAMTPTPTMTPTTTSTATSTDDSSETISPGQPGLGLGAGALGLLIAKYLRSRGEE